MAETETQHAMSAFSFPQPSIPHQIPTPQTSRGRGERATGGGEIVAVQGGHIVRSTGRKDRHSKVCTAKGPRDRRVRLSAHTAIQFYDVQDRLGYDRPSKAVDWLIKNAKDAIDKLAELPAWTPSTTCVSASPAGATSVNPLENQLMNSGMNVNVNSSFDFPPSLDSDAIADTIKSFFPMGAASSSAAPGGRSIGFQNYTAEPLSRSGSQSTQDLRLSLQSFQDSMYHHNHQHASSNITNLGFNTGSSSTLWPEPNQRIMQWSMPDTGTDGGGGATSYAYNMSLQNQNHHHHEASPMQNHNVLGQSQVYFQRGPLQSSNSPNIRSWAEPIGSDHPMHQTDGLYHHSVGSIGFESGGNPGSFPGFRFPARIQGEEEEHDGLSDKPPSSSHR